MADLKQLFNDLVRLEVELWDAVERRLRDEGRVGLGSFQTLDVIARVPDCRVGDVVRELSITVGGASKAVDRVEAAGLCARRPHPGDRRSSVIVLTAKGARARAAAEAVVVSELEQRIGAVLSTTAQAQLARTVARLRGTAQRRAES
jgi:DNA-binding MarR family transcriptional regulator